MDAVEELTATVPARWSQFGLTPVPMLIRILPQAQILILILCQNGTTDFSAIKKNRNRHFNFIRKNHEQIIRWIIFIRYALKILIIGSFGSEQCND